MLAISRALMSKPKSFCLMSRHLVLRFYLLNQYSEQIVALNKTTGLTILLVEQNANMALSIADYGYVMETGQICT